MDKIRLKIEKLEKAIKAQKEGCKDPCQTKCPIPVVTGEKNGSEMVVLSK